MSLKNAKLILALFLALPLATQSNASESSQRRMIILGVDGLDPTLTREFIESGKMPNFKRLASMGGFMPLGTSVPPQSPVAWSNFITGMDSGTHGIFDFLHLDRKTLVPYLSTARVVKAELTPLRIGHWQIPLSADRTLQLREGEAFWTLLEMQGIGTTMFRMPANYPPIDSGGDALSGMGTPDLQGTSGTFTYITDDPAFKPGDVPGGTIRSVSVQDGLVSTVVDGPPNPFLVDTPTSKTELNIYIDKQNPVAMIQVGRQRILLNVGEWSEWVTLDFELIPGLVRVPGMVRLFLKQTEPHFSLYVSPANIDPRDPAQPIAAPAEYAFELAEAAGPFYTQEMPEDTKALSAHVLSSREFLAQSGLVLDERRSLLKHHLKRFHEQPDKRFLFFYISSVDQRHHMLAKQMDALHPFHDADTPQDLAEAMQITYEEIDEIVGWAMNTLDKNTTLLVMSDHGFAPFRRQVHLNAWLEQNGYLKLKNPAMRNEYDWLQGIDWAETRAFAIGLNSLYLNVRGREQFGIVDPTDRVALAHEIAERLKAWQDDVKDEPVITQVLLREEVYSGPHVREAPDILVGYARGYRASWATTSGKIPDILVEDNDREWSGDHCMDSREVPGVLLANREFAVREADLRDLTVTVLSYFGVEAPEYMQGRSVF